MTAITPAFAHVCQFISLAGHIPGFLHSTRFCVPAAKARYPLLPNARTTTLSQH